MTTMKRSSRFWAQATVRAVVLDKTPTPEDTLAMGELAAELRQQIIDGADFEDMLGQPGVGAGSGDLGWFTREMMPEEFCRCGLCRRP